MSVYENINIIRKCFLDPRSDTHRQTDICDWRPTCLIGDRYACSESMQEKTTLSEPQIAFHPNYLCLIQLLYGLRWGMLVPNSLRWSILVSNKMCRSKKGLRSTILDFNWLQRNRDQKIRILGEMAIIYCLPYCSSCMKWTYLRNKTEVKTNNELTIKIRIKFYVN